SLSLLLKKQRRRASPSCAEVVMFNALLLVLAIQIDGGCNSEFFQNSWALLKDARWGTSRFEQAAFAVRESEGHITFARWPGSPEDMRAVYKGAIPSNAFAIVHTHPNGHGEPSNDDVLVARRLGMPVYVITRTEISFTTGSQIK